MVRFKEKYRTEVVPAMMERFGYKNVMEVPRFEKIVLNIGCGDAVGDPKALEGAVRDLEAIADRSQSSPGRKSPLPHLRFVKAWRLGARWTSVVTECLSSSIG